MTLRYRATVILKREAGGGATLMERYFKEESDAATWCQVMTRALPNASGIWFVGAIEPGRTLTIVHEAGLSELIDLTNTVNNTTRGTSESELSDEEAAILSDRNANALRIAPAITSGQQHAVGVGA